MKRILLYLLLISTVLSCKKEKFEKEYIGNFKGSFMVNNVEHYYSNIGLKFIFTEEHSDYVIINNVYRFEKNGRVLKANIPWGGGVFGQDLDTVFFNLKKNLFNDDIEGIFTTTVLSNPDDYESTGTVKLTAK